MKFPRVDCSFKVQHFSENGEIFFLNEVGWGSCHEALFGVGFQNFGRKPHHPALKFRPWPLCDQMHSIKSPILCLVGHRVSYDWKLYPQQYKLKKINKKSNNNT